MDPLPDRDAVPLFVRRIQGSTGLLETLRDLPNRRNFMGHRG